MATALERIKAASKWEATMVKTQVSGIMTYQDATLALDAGADALAFDLNPRSEYHVAPAAVREIADRLPPFVPVVGVFHNEFNFEALRSMVEAAKVSVIQLDGNESADYCRQLSAWRLIKKLRVGEDFDIERVKAYPTAAVILEGESTDGQGGRLFDWRYAAAAKQYVRIILSGGLTSENVATAIRTVKPYAVNVREGVESTPGRKDRIKLQTFMIEVERGKQEAARSTTGRLPRLDF
ncbi:MAG: phosphoribosylanthranilate isomerase [Chloracidobacterium sp.]